MAYTTIDDPGLFFNSLLYTGNAGTQSITGVGFQPDLLWIKCRGAAEIHTLVDSVRGDSGANTGYFYLASSATSADGSGSGNTLVSAIGSDGFSLGNNDRVNIAQPFVSWNWLGSNTTASNGNGSITSTISVNTTSGFSIVKYQGTGANATVGHGLGAVPKIILFKSLANVISWIVYSSELNISSSNCLRLNGTNAAFTESAWNGTRPTTSVFSLGPHNEANNNSGETIAYCFADVQGYSKSGSYTGNGSIDGTFVYTGFEPAFVMVKKTSATNNWVMMDNKRDPFNMRTEYLLANDNTAEGTGLNFDFLSNGFKLKSNSGGTNTLAGTYIYMAFAENPFVSSTGIPACAG